MKKLTKFNSENKEILTYGDCLEPAMKITDKEDAEQYFESYVEYIQRFLDKNPREDNKTAEDIAKNNLGYFAGYYSNETRERVERLFLCEHPVFGSIKERGIPTTEEAFKMGMDYTKKT